MPHTAGLFTWCSVNLLPEYSIWLSFIKHCHFKVRGTGITCKGRHTFDYFRLLAKLVISVISEEMSMFLSILTYFPRLISITCSHFGASSCRSFKWASTATEKENAWVRLSYEPMSATLMTARTGYIKNILNAGFHLCSKAAVGILLGFILLLVHRTFVSSMYLTNTTAALLVCNHTLMVKPK